MKTLQPRRADRSAALPARRRAEVGAAHGLSPAAARPPAARCAWRGALSHALRAHPSLRACNTFTEEAVCELCRSPRRDASLLCVVETPADLLMMEQTQCYRGMYFVLMGRLSPLDGIGPREIHLDRLVKRAQDGSRAGGDTGDQLHRRGRGHRALHRRACCAPQGSRSPASRAACRWAANWSTSTAARWRRRCSDRRPAP